MTCCVKLFADGYVMVGIAPNAWGVWFADDPRQMPWRRYLDEVGQAGFGWTELGPYGYLPTDPAALEQELSSRNLTLASGSVMFDLEDADHWRSAAEHVSQVCALVRTLGGRFLLIVDDMYTELVTGKQRRPQHLDATGWSRLVQTTRRICEVADEHGLYCAFHPHAQTHVELEEQIEQLLDDAPDLMLCLDFGQHAYSGGDPVQFLRRYSERISYLHLKNVDGEICQRVRRDGISFGPAVAQGVFVEPSDGIVDFRVLRSALEEIAYDGFAIVEQDMYPTEFDRPLPIARRTYAYLQELGLA